MHFEHDVKNIKGQNEKFQSLIYVCIKNRKYIY